MSEFFAVYRKLADDHNNELLTESQYEEKCYRLFEEALAIGDSRMATELSDNIFTMYEVEAPAVAIVKYLNLLNRFFPDMAAECMEEMAGYEF